MSLQLETQEFVNSPIRRSVFHSPADHVAPASKKRTGDQPTVFVLILKDLLLIGSALVMIAGVFVFGIVGL